MLQGEHAKAIQLLREIKDRYPRDVELLTRLGEAYMGAGNTAEAETVFRRLAELEPDNPEHAGPWPRLAMAETSMTWPWRP
jgi:Flp pilus assembly protein TadD